MSGFDLITIIGPTASGKTKLAVALSHRIKSEIISADSRQVYKGMDIGTGKDLSEYKVDGHQIPFHLIDICDAGEKYNVYEFQHDFHRVYSFLKEKGILPVLCGGSGMYIESVLKGYKLLSVPENQVLRKELENKSIDVLKSILSNYTIPHNNSDFETIKRAIRAIEIADYTINNQPDVHEFKALNSLIIGLNPEREIRRKKISVRLKERLNEGLIDEVKLLLNRGISPNDLIYYGLEYKFVTQFIIGELTYQQMFSKLEIAIHQFAKRQMTWFNGMERRGFKINWIDNDISIDEKVNHIISLI